MSKGAADERGFEAIRRIRESQKDLNPLRSRIVKALVREQYFMLLIDAPATVAAIPAMLPSKPARAPRALEMIKQVVEATGALPPEGAERLRNIETLFSSSGESKPAPVVNMRGETAVVQTRPKCEVPDLHLRIMPSGYADHVCKRKVATDEAKGGRKA
jgi:hypothetical protein